MYKKIVINVAEHETRVALLEDGTIAELFIERNDGSDIAGNIYKGRVQRVLPGMQAAFVDIGLDQAAFIYVDDVLGDNLKEIERLFESVDCEDEAPLLEDGTSQGAFVSKSTNIEDCVEAKGKIRIASNLPSVAKSAKAVPGGSQPPFTVFH